MFQRILQYFNLLYLSKYPNIIQPLLAIENECEANLHRKSEFEESIYTYKINKFLCNIYDNLTEDEQADMLAEILSEYILEDIGQEENDDN